MDTESSLKSVKRILALQTMMILFLLVWIVGAAGLRSMQGWWNELKVVRTGDSVRLASISDGPYVVTHLTVRGRDVESEADKRIAALDPPMAIIDSEGGEIEDIRKLSWKDIRGELASPPESDVPLTALWVRPNYAGRD